MDCGLLAYSDDDAPPGVEPESTIAGPVWFGIDSFTYFEQFADDPRVPPLIYHWRVDEIWRVRVTTPWVETSPRYVERDRTHAAVAPVEATDAWDDDGGYASYILGVTRLDHEPTQTRH